jgi:hypothetical protein
MLDRLSKWKSNPALTIALGLMLTLAIVWLAVDRPEKAERRLVQRIESGKAVPHHFYVPVYLWRGLTVNVLLAGLTAAASFWAGRRFIQSPSLPGTPEPSRKWETGAVLFCALLAGLSAGIRLGHSTWGDEDYTVKTYINPQYERQADGELLIGQPVPLTDVLWHYKRPNNHVGYTFVARLVHDTFFTPGSEPSSPLFSETLVRLPAFVFGLLSVFSIAWMARVWGWSKGLPLVLVFYVTHPWLVRFSSDARAYSAVLAAVPLLLALFKLVTETGRWRWWLLLSLVQAWVFWCYWGVVYVLVPFQLALGLALFTTDKWCAHDKKALLGRWLVSGLISTMIIVQLMAPNLPQMLDYIRTSAGQLNGRMDLTWWQDAVALMLFGTPFHAWSDSAPYCIALEKMEWTTLTSAGMAAVVLAHTLVAGCMALWKEKTQRWLLLPVLGGPGLFLLHMFASGFRPYHWYLILYLPGLLVLLFAALAPCMEALTKFLFKPQEREPTLPLRALAAGFLAMAIGLAALTASPMRKTLQRHPLEPSRESVALMRKVFRPEHPDYGKESVTAGFTMFTEAYDPGMIRFQTLTELQQIIHSTHASGRDLFINFSSRPFCKANYPELFVWFDDPGKFQHIATLPGSFDAGTREVIKAVRPVQIP